MASHYYGVPVGGQMPGDVTEGTSTTSKSVELVVDLTAAGLSKVAVLKALEAIQNRVTVDNWPPA
jgi:hypothetical protein